MSTTSLRYHGATAALPTVSILAGLGLELEYTRRVRVRVRVYSQG